MSVSDQNRVKKLRTKINMSISVALINFVILLITIITIVVPAINQIDDGHEMNSKATEEYLNYAISERYLYKEEFNDIIEEGNEKIESGGRLFLIGTFLSIIVIVIMVIAIVITGFTKDKLKKLKKEIEELMKNKTK